MNAEPQKTQAAPAAATPAKPVPVTVTSFRLEHFEWLVSAGKNEEAAAHLIFLLTELDSSYGQWGTKFECHAPGIPRRLVNQHICTRLAAAITALFSSPGFRLSREGYQRFMRFHRWLSLIFAVSPFRNGDHIIRNRNDAGGGLVNPLTLSAKSIHLFCMSYFPDSDIPLQLDQLWLYDRETVVTLFFAILSNRVLPTPAAHRKRELLLAWLPERLADIKTLDFLPKAVLHDVVMHCSYADLPSKHEIKRGINKLIEAAIMASPARALLPIAAPPADRPKPMICVILEWFGSTHSIYRTHSTTIRALREHFHVVGIGATKASDPISQKVFDEFFEMPGRDAFAVVKKVAELRPDIIYYPSVGMFGMTVHLVNLRLAPLQFMALGHPATTHSPYIDGVLVEEDYLGDPACFSEPVIAVPKDAIPYLPPTNMKRIPPRPAVAPAPGQPVRVAICASIMKINPTFLNTLAEIERRCRRPMRFCFFMAMAQGITVDYLRDAILAVLPNAETHAHLPIPEYQAKVNECDLFVNPFPFGNTNGLVDGVRQGLPGVCLSGPEVHTHIDEGLFRRLGLPEELIAGDHEAYIRAAVRLIEDDAWRLSLHRQLVENDVEAVLFKGRPEKFVEAIREVYEAKKRAA